MVEKEGYRISDIYQGGYSSLTPQDYSKKTYTAGSFGMTTDPRSANILKEVSSKLSMGVKQIEIEGVDAGVFDSIPKQQLKEVNRLAKLTGIDVSLHGPVTGMNVSGITQQGFSEAEREAMERKVADALLRAHDLNPDGNIPVNFHSSEGLPASQLLPPSEREEGKEYKKLFAVNRDSGRITALEPEEKYYPDMKHLKPGVEKQLESGKLTPEEVRANREKYFEKIPLEKGKYYSPERRLKELNDSEWDNSLNQIFFNQERANEILGKNQVQIAHVIDSINEMKKQGVSDGQIFQTLNPEARQAYSNYKTAENYLQDVHQQVNGFFSKAYEFGTPEQKHALKKMSEEFGKELEKNGNDPFKHAQAMQNMTNSLKEITPKMWAPLEEFATEKTAQTFGSAAFQAYKKYKDKTPILVIENPPASQALSTGKDIRNVVEKSREQFVKKAMEEGMSKSSANQQAEKLIGATWDVGHINMLRKFGYSEKDIIKESEEVAPFVKHVHLSDNFGFEHTELPMGMGNVPLKEIMEKLGDKGFEARKIIEAGHWWQHFQSPPFQEVLEATGTPLYSMKMSPSWGQAPGLYQGYFSGYGQMLPQINYETFGAGFSRLPVELGGSAPGAGGSRMSGRPME